LYRLVRLHHALLEALARLSVKPTILPPNLQSRALLRFHMQTYRRLPEDRARLLTILATPLRFPRTHVLPLSRMRIFRLFPLLLLRNKALSSNEVYPLFSSPPSPTSSPYDATLLLRLRLRSLSISCCFACTFSTPKRSIAPFVDSKPAATSKSSSSTNSLRLSGNGNTKRISFA